MAQDKERDKNRESGTPGEFPGNLGTATSSRPSGQSSRTERASGGVGGRSEGTGGSSGTPSGNVGGSATTKPGQSGRTWGGNDQDRSSTGDRSDGEEREPRYGYFYSAASRRIIGRRSQQERSGRGFESQYGRRGSWSPGIYESQGSGFGSQEGYGTGPSSFGQTSGYGSPRGYEARGGAGWQGRYGSQGDYRTQRGFETQGGYSGQSGFGRSPSGYGPESGYGSQGGYATQGDYGTQGGYDTQGGYGRAGTFGRTEFSTQGGAGEIGGFVPQARRDYGAEGLGRPGETSGEPASRFGRARYEGGRSQVTRGDWSESGAQLGTRDLDFNGERPQAFGTERTGGWSEHGPAGPYGQGWSRFEREGATGTQTWDRGSFAEGRRTRWQREPLTAREIMTRDIKAVTKQSTIKNVAQIMKDENVGIVPIVDESHKLLGVVTDRDLAIRCLADAEKTAELRVEDVMTDDVEAVTPDESLLEVVELMGEKQIRRVPVVDRDDRLVGIIAMGDIANRADFDEELQEALEKISAKRSFWARF